MPPPLEPLNLLLKAGSKEYLGELINEVFLLRRARGCCAALCRRQAKAAFAALAS